MKVVTFGEIMLRLASPGHTRLMQADILEATYGGGEANVAVSLANYGADTSFVTKLPDNPLGLAAINSLRRYGVNTDYIVRGGDRIGIYFLEKGASQRPSNVIYDRACSAIAVAGATDFDWGKIFKGADWFHFTGITPAISGSAAEITLQAVKAAKILGLTVSCDLNYRKKLWSRERAKEVMTGLSPYIDLCVSNEEDAFDVFGVKAEKTDITKGEIDRDGYISVAKQLNRKYGFKQVAVTLRESLSADDNIWSGLFFDGREGYFSRKYKIHIVDRVGGGDSFGAGLIYALTNKYLPQNAIEFAAAASCLKHTIEGDYNLVSVDEVNKLLQGDGSGRVVR